MAEAPTPQSSAPDPVELGRRALALAESSIEDGEESGAVESQVPIAAAVEAYSRAAVHLAGLAAIGQGAQLGAKGYSETAVSTVVWEVLSEGNLEEIGAEGLLRRILQRLEGG